MTKSKVFWSFVLAVVIVFGGLFLLKKNHKEQLPVLFYTYQEGSEGFYPYWADWDYSKGESFENIYASTELSAGYSI